jgi:hypothetical protein
MKKETLEGVETPWWEFAKAIGEYEFILQDSK